MLCGMSGDWRKYQKVPSFFKGVLHHTQSIQAIEINTDLAILTKKY